MTATIIIVSLNEGERLWKTVRSCLETTAGLNYEVLVADDSSDDGSLQELQDYCGEVRVVSHEERRGVASTKDLGARRASGDVLIFLDGHCKPESGALSRLVADVEELDGRAVVTPAVPALDTETWENRRDAVGYGFAIELEGFTCRWADRSTMRPRITFSRARRSSDALSPYIGVSTTS